MPPKQPNKNEIRTKETRELLLKSAETIFVRDGYEAAELGEIAFLANRSKGAIYSHFESKEDLFLALFKDRNAQAAANVEKLLAGSKSKEENVKLLRKFFLGLLKDEAWCLLTLEFKLFAKRHPESKERLVTLYLETPLQEQEAKVVEVFGAAGRGAEFIPRTMAIAALGAVLSAIALEMDFAPALSDKSAAQKVLGHLYDALMRSASERAASS